MPIYAQTLQQYLLANDHKALALILHELHLQGYSKKEIQDAISEYIEST